MGRRWTAEEALDRLAACDLEGEIEDVLGTMQRSMRPTPREWLGKRLPVLWTQYMASREADPRALTVWLAETARHLQDVPHDILAHAIDQAIRSSRHGFMPSVGEIRGVADPLLSEREQQIERLRLMVIARADPTATAARAQRRGEAGLRLSASRGVCC